jgi:hypothetical protein
MPRVVVEHPDGRRVSVNEADIDNPEHNPFNRSRQITSFDGNTGAQVSYTFPARPADDHISLRDEGFVIVADLATEEVKDEDGNILVHVGGEVARDADLYRGEGLDRAADMTDLGKRLADEHAKTADRLDRQHRPNREADR